MKIKEINQTANIAWSPAGQYPIYLATGTAAQQVDASFSTTSKIDLFSLDLENPGLDMTLKASVPTKQRFHKLVWGSQGMSTGDKPSGVIVGGADLGNILLFDAAKLLKGNNDETGAYLLSDSRRHSGAVKALDFNPFQQNLLASGATESEIFIWDLNSPAAPMTPGTLSQPPDEVTCLAWNRQVQHILASTFSSRCVVWDLRKNEPIIKVSDSTSRMRCKAVAWHPKVATQLCLASEDDQLPVIQLWDLRQATAPLNTFEGHGKGILSIDWCSQDPDLLLSCGKDNFVLVWNPNSHEPRGEVVGQLSTSNHWCFDAIWCPRNPSCIATANFDGHVSVHSIMGGRETTMQLPTANLIADSFPGMETAPSLQPPQQQVIVHEQLKRAPKWLRKPTGASFGFGGKLISFGVEAGGAANAAQQVHISQVITEEELALRSQELENVLKTGNLAEYCTQKSMASGKHQEAWTYIAANFSQSPRQQFLQLLGYESKDSLDIAKSIDALDLDTSQSDTFDSIAAEVASFSISTDDSVDGKIGKALIAGNLAVAVDICFGDKRYADALVLAMTGSSELLASTRDRYFRIQKGDTARLIQAVATRNYQQIAQHCNTENWKEALAATLTYAEEGEFAALCQTIGQRLESEKNATSKAVLCYICAGSMEKLVDCWLRAEDDSTSSLQEMVEQVMVMRQAQQQWGHQPVSVNSGHLTQQLCRYAGLLAGQGSLEAALTYLDMSQDESMMELKERLQRALGQTGRKVSSGLVNGSYSNVPQHKQRPQYPMAIPSKPSTPGPSYGFGQQEAFNAVPTYPPRPTTPFQNNSWQSSSFVSQPPVPPMQPTQIAPPPVAQLPQQFNSPLPPPPPTSAVPPPTSGNVSRVGPLTQRNRVYVQDPSVSSGHSNQYFNPNPQYPSPNQSSYAPQQYQPNTGMFQPSAAGSQMNTSFQQPNSFPVNQFNVTPSIMSGSFASPNNSLSSPPMGSLMNGQGFDNNQHGIPPAALYNPMDNHSPVQQPTAFMQPVFGENIPSITPPPSTLPAVPILPASNPPPGWNDPPPLTSYTKAKMEAAFEPITHPIFPSGVVEQPAIPSIQNYDGILTPSILPPAELNSQQYVPEPTPVQPPAPLLPIPSENVIIHDVFHTLKDKCLAQASNAQMKRKLEDVGKKLESLDDLLRNNLLLSPTLMGLHQIVQEIMLGDYATSLNLHAQVVINTPFTEIGTFISGLKVLLQMSQQLGVSYK